MNLFHLGTQAQILKANKTPPLASEEIRALLERITHLGQQSSEIHKFSILRPMNQKNLPQDAAVAIPWRLDLNLRFPEFSELYQLLLKLFGNRITHSISAPKSPIVRLANLHRSPLANAISQRLRK